MPRSGSQCNISMLMIITLLALGIGEIIAFLQIMAFFLHLDTVEGGGKGRGEKMVWREL